MGRIGRIRGQSIIEYALLISAVVAAVLVMRGYTERAMNAFRRTTTWELNGATEENRP